jgi:hypothetical protein
LSLINNGKERYASSMLKRLADFSQPSHRGLVSARECLAALFPNEQSRPSLRWFLQLKADGLIPFRRIGRLVFFDVEEVRQAIDSRFTIRMNN